MEEPVEVLPRRPDDISPWAVIQFGADYSAEHPVWTLGGLADLESMRLPAPLESRLQRWAAYWDQHHDFETGWPSGLPEGWWRQEQIALPRALAETIGLDAIVLTVEGVVLRSRASGTSSEAAAAMRESIAVGEAEDRRFEEEPVSGSAVAADIALQFPSSSQRRTDGD